MPIGTDREDVTGDAETARKGERPAYFPPAGGFVTTPVYDRYRLGSGSTMAGPAIIEERESTAIIGPGGRVRVDDRLNIVVSLGGET